MVKIKDDIKYINWTLHLEKSLICAYIIVETGLLNKNL